MPASDYFDRDPSSMSRIEQEAELADVRARLKDIEDTFNFNIANTPGHIHEGMLHEHEAELYAYRERIELLEDILGIKSRKR